MPPDVEEIADTPRVFKKGASDTLPLLSSVLDPLWLAAKAQLTKWDPEAFEATQAYKDAVALIGPCSCSLDRGAEAVILVFDRPSFNIRMTVKAEEVNAAAEPLKAEEAAP